MTGAASERSLTIHPGQFPVDVVQAIYHHVTAKTEKLTETFSGSFNIEFKHLEDLNNKIFQTCNRHHNGEWSCTVDVSLKNAENMRFTSFERFKLFDASNPAATKMINYNFDFLAHTNGALREAEIRPERYKITVRIDQDVELDDDDEDRPSFLIRMMSGRNIAVRIEYVDYVIARAVLAAVRDWVAALEVRAPRRMIELIVKNTSVFSILLPLLVLATSIPGLFFGWLRPALNAKEVSPDITILVWAISAAIIIYAIASWLTTKCIDACYALQQRTFICLTSGDGARKQKIENSERVLKTWVFGGFGGIGLSVVSNLIAAALQFW